MRSTEKSWSNPPEAVDAGVENEGAGEHDGLVEEIAHHAARAPVVPPPMHQQQLPKVCELSYRVV